MSAGSATGNPAWHQRRRRSEARRTRPSSLRSAFSRSRRPGAAAGSSPPANRRQPLPRQVLEAVGLEQRLVELAPLRIVHFGQRRVADDLLDAAAQLGARHWQSLDRTTPGPIKGQPWSGLLLCMETVSGTGTGDLLPLRAQGDSEPTPGSGVEAGGRPAAAIARRRTPTTKVGTPQVAQGQAVRVASSARAL